MPTKSGKDGKKAKPDKPRENEESSAETSSVASKRSPKFGHATNPQSPKKLPSTGQDSLGPVKQSASSTAPQTSYKDSENRILDIVLFIPIHVEIGEPLRNELNLVSRSKEKSMTSNTYISPSNQTLLKSYMSGMAKNGKGKKKEESDKSEWTLSMLL